MSVLVFWAVCLLAAIVVGCVMERLVPHIGADLFPTDVDEPGPRCGPAELGVRAELTAATLAYIRQQEIDRLERELGIGDAS